MIRLLGLLCCLLLWQCSPILLEPLPNDAVILAFGNSLTYGIGAKQEQSYPNQLSTLIKRKVVNQGVPGEETKQGKARLIKYLRKHKVDLVLLCHGGNDMLRKRDLKQTEANIIEMIDIARENGAQVVLIAVPEPGLLLSDHKMYKRISKATQTPLVDDVMSDLLSDRATKSDAIHPNAKGYQVLAKTIADLLFESGAL